MRGFCNFPLVLLIAAATRVFLLADSKTYWRDVEVLKQLKNAIDPKTVSPGSCLSSWDFAYDPCESRFGERFTCGFSCDTAAARVTEIALDPAGYAGSLPSNISWQNLHFLETLDLSNNYFAGWIPNSLSNLSRLRRLALSGNAFSGEIPTSIGSLSGLEELFLDGNRFEGKIPASFGGLASLKRLELQGNKLSGEFLDLSSIKNLFMLDASDNAISGGVPENFPASLVEISMRNNRLEGSVPAGVKKLGFLQVMDLSHNNLSGAVPSFLFSHPSLQQLTLSFNRFSSVQSPSAGERWKSQLVAVDLSSNELRGFLPAFMVGMPRLTALSLENNKFTGMVPLAFALKAAAAAVGGGAGKGAVAPFARLLLGGNYLLGTVPGPLMRLKPGEAAVSLADNCLYSCPLTFFFCQGLAQKPLPVCEAFGSVIPRTL